MRFSLPHPATLAAVPALTALAALGLAPFALATVPAPPTVTVQDQALGIGETIAPQQLGEPVTDYIGILDASERASIEESIREYRIEGQKNIFVVYLSGFGGMTAQDWAEASVAANGGGNTAVIAIAVDDRQFGIQGGAQWTDPELDDMYEAAFARLSVDDWAGASEAAVDAAASSGQVSGESLAWLGGGAAAAVAAGGGIWAYSRRKRRQDEAALLEDSRAIDPADTRRLMGLPTPTLEQLAEEELISTDESIRLGREELDLAVAEFGPERTRSFTRAMNHSTTTLQKAFQLQQQLNDSVPESETERRGMLVEIISSCGQADDALDAEAENFAQMRNLLVNADSKLRELTQRTIDLRARLPHAEEQFATLAAQYSSELLASLSDNVEMARVSLDEAEKALATGRELADRPAGEQGGLVETIREAEHATEVTDRLLVAVEHAEQNIHTAKNNLADLITEIEEEIAEAAQLKRQGTSQGAPADWQALDEVVEKATAALENARQTAASDPLGAYTTLTDIDADLDEQLDRVRETTATQARQLQLLDQQLNSAASGIQAAEDLISSRGRVVKAQARTLLADAQRLHAHALHERTTDTRGAINLARQASDAAQRASRQAQSDVDDYRRRQNFNQPRGRGGGGTGSFIAGMVINQMLSGGGGGGGFGGGFGGGGGGGFRGGGFGGGGGGFRGGSF